jgi:hypothetical protein
MNHSDAVRLMASEKYLLNELEPQAREDFEDHMFGCQECAVDVRSGMTMIQHSKVVLGTPEPVLMPKRNPVTAETAVKPGWFAWLRPALAVPVLALLLAIVGYQNFVTVPKLEQAVNQPQLLPWETINVRTRGVAPTQISGQAGKGFSVFVVIPQDKNYTSYTAHLYNPSGKLEWSTTGLNDGTKLIQIPGANRAQGTYKLSVQGVTATGENSELGPFPIDFRIQP